MGNLVKLCRYHHTQLHLGRFTIEIMKDECTSKKRQKNNPTLIFKSPTGKVIPNEESLPKCTVEGFFEQQWPDITSTTCVTLWQGEIMDYGMAIDGLLDSRKKPGSDCSGHSGPEVQV